MNGNAIFRIGAIAGLLMLICQLASAAQHPVTTKPSRIVSLSACADAIQPAGFPIVAQITITNVGKQKVEIDHAGPGEYAPASVFSASLRDGSGKWHEVSLFNGQAESWAQNGMIVIAPGAIWDTPISLPPMQAGIVQVKFAISNQHNYCRGTGPSKAITIHVVNNAAVALDREYQWIEHIEHGEPFARRLAEQYPMPKITPALLVPLTDVRPNVWDAQFLRGTPVYNTSLPNTVGDEMSDMKPADLPPDTDMAVLVAINRAVAEKDNPPFGLARLASKIKSDTALRALLELLHAKMDDQSRSDMIQFLASFKQPAATDALVELLKKGDLQVRAAAAITLAKRHNPIAIPELIADIRDQAIDAHDCRNIRGRAVRPLANFSADPRVLPAIKAATHDYNHYVASAARDLLPYVISHQARTTTSPANEKPPPN